jgi:hypothetical protein
MIEDDFDYTSNYLWTLRRVTSKNCQTTARLFVRERWIEKITYSKLEDKRYSLCPEITGTIY